MHALCLRNFVHVKQLLVPSPWLTAAHSAIFTNLTPAVDAPHGSGTTQHLSLRPSTMPSRSTILWPMSGCPSKCPVLLTHHLSPAPGLPSPVGFHAHDQYNFDIPFFCWLSPQQWDQGSCGSAISSFVRPASVLHSSRSPLTAVPTNPHSALALQGREPLKRHSRTVGAAAPLQG